MSARRPARLALAWILASCAVAACAARHTDEEVDDGVDDSAPAQPVSGDAGATDSSPKEAAAPPSKPPRQDASAPPQKEAGAQDAAVPDLFDPATIPEFELSFDAAALAVLSSTAEADRETWVHGTLKFGSMTFADVGVRRKGSVTFRALPQKASFKVKLNKYVKGQKLYGLESLTLNNQIGSYTYVTERISYYFFRSLGLPAQRANTAKVKINGEDYGIYLNVETPDEEFLARVFGAKAKTLYEANWGSEWLPGKEPGFEIDVEDPLAPVGTRPDLTALFDSVQAATDANLLADVAAHLHTTQWLQFSAAEGVAAQWDGYGYGIPGSHNYFMAGDVDGKFSLVPWSLDSSLYEGEGPIDMNAPLNQTLLTRCKQSVTCWALFKTEAKTVIDTFEQLDLVTLAKAWHNQIDALVRADPKREAPIAYYEQRTTSLYDWLAARPAIARAQLGIGP
jgi:hypothetical protein